LEPAKLRTLDAHCVNKLVTVKGIVISSSPPQLKAKMVHIRCKSCGYELHLKLTSSSIPPFCNNPNKGTTERCPQEPFEIITEKSEFEDLQSFKLQELPEELPPGETPRTLFLTVNRYLIDRVKSGFRIRATGVVSIPDTKTKDNLPKQAHLIRSA